MMVKQEHKALFDNSNNILRPYLLDIGNGVWMLAYTKYNGVNTCNPIIRFSDDEGETWTAENKTLSGLDVTGLPNQSTYAYVQAMPIKCANGDLLMHIPANQNTTRNGTAQYRSTDGGRSWSDEGKIQSDNTILGASDVCVVDNDIYVTVFVDPGGDSTAPYTPKLLKSTNNGVSWSTVSSLVASGFNETSIAIAPNGNMIAVMRSDNGSSTKQVISEDAGLTWSSPIDITAIVGVMQKPVMFLIGSVLYLLGRRVIGTFSGTADSIYGRQKTEIYRSNDGGSSWTGPWVYHEDWVWGCGYTSMLQRINGDFFIIDYRATSPTKSYITCAVLVP